MVRAPAGWHLAAGSLPAVGSPTHRTTPLKQSAYWRQSVAELRVGATAVVGPGTSFPAQSLIPATATAGPQGIGERWLPDMVQVQYAPQIGQPPLVTQQVAAQVLGTTTAQPPPITAQVWLSVGGLNVHLLAQTSQGGNDNLSIGCPPLSPGEAIAVVWYGWAPAGAGGLPYFILRGTKHVLGQ
jgi:hypothetical protein